MSKVLGLPKFNFTILIFVTFVLALLTSCASIEAKEFVGPNGKKAYTMRCSGMGRTLDACYQKAGEVCPNGYKIIGQETGTVAVPVNGSIIAAPQRNLTIECE